MSFLLVLILITDLNSIEHQTASGTSDEHTIVDKKLKQTCGHCHIVLAQFLPVFWYCLIDPDTSNLWSP